MQKPIAPPPVLLVTAAAVQLLLGKKKKPSRSILRRVLGGSAALAGAGLFVAGGAQLLARSTTVDPLVPGESTELVTDGVYGYTRNPIYVGDLLLLLGLAIGQGKLISYLPVVAFAALIDRRQIPLEEAALAETFGDDFNDYAEQVPRWL
ncbi:methyltransferase family protein [Naumannella halotolerans]|uniref:methyltransferase family protein n=1 Tax=Naumannella halotolerans TaxID=993414 RepID=UPI00370D8BBC